LVAHASPKPERLTLGPDLGEIKRQRPAGPRFRFTWQTKSYLPVFPLRELNENSMATAGATDGSGSVCDYIVSPAPVPEVFVLWRLYVPARDTPLPPAVF
jgi:hypothetical protein